jgi:hypothetical protein
LNASLAQLAPVLLAQVPGLGRRSPDISPKYFELLERNSHIIYPTLALAVVALVILGILQAWRAHDLDGLAKLELKREIILELRKTMGGASADMLARAVGLEPLKIMKLLEEMQRDGILLSHTNTSRLTVWRLKGVGVGGQMPQGPYAR